MNQTIKKGQLEFVEFHQPNLKDGDYHIKVTQTIDAGSSETFTAEKWFTVAGERFSLLPQQIKAVFPANGNQGDHSNVLPHVILERSTIPWERMSIAPQSGDGKQIQDLEAITPWLALLVFDEDELHRVLGPIIVKRGDLVAKSSSPFWLGADLETCEQSNEQVTVIDVEYDLLKSIMPKASELHLLAHVRVTSDSERAIVIANRLPRAGKTSVCHLVALENRFFHKGEGPVNDLSNFQFEFGPEPAKASVRLVSLKQWSFHCLDSNKNFKDTLQHLNLKLVAELESSVEELETQLDQNEVGATIQAILSVEFGREVTSSVEPGKEIVSSDPQTGNRIARTRWPLIENGQRIAIAQMQIHDSKTSMSIFRDQGSSVRLPLTANNEADKFLGRCFVPMKYKMRSGAETTAWYHGPLVNWDHEVEPSLPASCADELMRYQTETGMFDVSYAAAWELGRLMALNSGRFSTDLFQWKRRHAQKLLQTEQRLLHPHLPGHEEATELDDFPLPEVVTQWFQDRSLLKGVPFNYLVPDEKALPQESLKFFVLDQYWIACLLDGAFAIGRVASHELKQDSNRRGVVKLRHYDVSGVIIRSTFVTDWPGLQIEAYDQFIENENSVPLKSKLFQIPDPDARFRNALALLKLDDVLATKINAVLAGNSSLWESKPISDDWELSLAHRESWTLNDRPNHRRFCITVENDELVFCNEPKLPVLRMEQLGPGVLLCLFEGVVRTLDIHQQPDMLHFGFEHPDEAHPNFYKKLRDMDGRALEENNNSRELTPVTFAMEAETLNSDRVIDFVNLKNGIDEQLQRHGLGQERSNVAEFSMQMIQGVDKVRFVGNKG